MLAFPARGLSRPVVCWLDWYRDDQYPQACGVSHYQTLRECHGFSGWHLQPGNPQSLLEYSPTQSPCPLSGPNTADKVVAAARYPAQCSSGMRARAPCVSEGSQHAVACRNWPAQAAGGWSEQRGALAHSRSRGLLTAITPAVTKGCQACSGAHHGTRRRCTTTGSPALESAPLSAHHRRPWR